MESVATLFFSGLVFGLSGGLAPGPLLTLTISQTLRFGVKEGIKITLAPAFTDIPIILIAVFILTRLAAVEPLLGVITLAGGLFLIYLGWESVTFKGLEYTNEAVQPKSIRKGIIANFLNPSPYLFWFTIGGPILVKVHEPRIAGILMFILALYVCLIGSKVLVAVLVGRSRLFLKSRNYVYTLKFLGLVLWGFAVVFLKNSLGYFGLF